jgi:hypothetical protein
MMRHIVSHGIVSIEAKWTKLGSTKHPKACKEAEKTLKFSAPRHAFSVTKTKTEFTKRWRRSALQDQRSKSKYIKDFESYERRKLERTIDKSTKNEDSIQNPAASIIEQEIKDSC